MKDGTMKGLFCMGQNPAVGGQNAVLGRQALANLDWLVVRDVHEIETAAFWYDAPEVHAGKVRPQEIKTEIFLMPAAIAAEKDGSFTNTQRLVQWHDKSVEPPGDARSEAWFVYHLGRRLRELYHDDESPRGRPWSERKKWVWWDAEQGKWTGYDVPDFPPTKPPDYRPPPGAKGLDAHPGDAPFLNMADGKGWLFAASGLRDGPLPTHYEPW